MRKVAYWLSLGLILVLPMENVVIISGLGRLSRAIGLVVAAFWFVTVIVTGRFRRLQPAHFVIILFITWNMLGVLWSIDVDRSIERIQTYIQLAGMVLIIWDLYTTPAALRAGMQAYVLGAWVSAVGTIHNYFALSEFSHRRYSAAGLHVDDLGLILALGLPLAWHLIHVDVRRSKIAYLLSVVNYAYMPVASLGILLSGTRAAMIAAVPAFLFVFGTLARFKPVVRVLLLGTLVWSMFEVKALVPQSSFKRLGSIDNEIAAADLQGRVDIWRQGFEVFSKHPILGVGPDAYRMAVAEGKVAHNTFISILVEGGAIGFALFAVFLAIVIYQAASQAKWDARLWLTSLLVWATGTLTLTWEHRKPTWLILSFVLVSASLSARRDESEPITALPSRVTEYPERATTSEAHHAPYPISRSGPRHTAGDHGLPLELEIGRGG
jgi:O-antigen ligase